MRFAVLAAVLGLALIGGCGGPAHLPPGIGIGALENQGVVQGAEGQALKMVVHVDVSNHEQKAIELQSAEYRLEVAGMSVGRGSYRGRVSVAGGSRVAVALPLEIDTRRLSGTGDAGRAETEGEHKGMVRGSLIGAIRFLDDQGKEGYHEPIDAVVWVPLPKR